MVAPALSSSVVDPPLSCLKSVARSSPTWTSTRLSCTRRNVYQLKVLLVQENSEEREWSNPHEESPPQWVVRLRSFPTLQGHMEEDRPVYPGGRCLSSKKCIGNKFYFVHLKPPSRNVFWPAILRNQIFTTRDGGPFPKPPLSLFWVSWFSNVHVTIRVPLFTSLPWRKRRQSRPRR